MTHRTTARIVGGLFIAAEVGVLAAVLRQPALVAGDYLTAAALNVNRMATAALLDLIMGMAVVGIAIAIYPVLRRFRARLALGYVAGRTIESMLIVGSVIGGLTLLTIGQKVVHASPPDAALQTMGVVLLAQRDWVIDAVLPIVFALDALILNYVLHQARLVPRWVSAWGLVGAALWLAAGVMVTYGLASVPALAAPIGAQEIALALWLIVKGFNDAAFSSEYEEESAASQALPPRESRPQLGLRPGS